MDNKPFEEQAEAAVKLALLKADLHVTKPSFDVLGADLVVLKTVTGKKTPFVRIQSKGRSVNNDTQVEIPASYVTDNFVLFVYLQAAGKDEELLVFFETDITAWPLAGNQYRLRILRSVYQGGFIAHHRYSEKSAQRIKDILFNQQVVKLYNTILIDGIFLRNAIRETERAYAAIYPDKAWQTPQIREVMRQLRRYIPLAKNNELHGYIIESNDFTLKEFLVWDDGPFGQSKEEEVQEIHPYEIFWSQTNDMVVIKIIEQLERIINTENVLLVADDLAYVPYLKQLADRGLNVTVAQLKGDFGSRMVHTFPYLDIMYPLGIAIGLREDEL